MSVKEVIFPKALNIVRPQTPSIRHQDSSQSSSTVSSSSPSTISTFSSYSAFNHQQNHARVPPTIVTPSNYAYIQNNWANFKSVNPVANTVGVNPHRFLQRPRSNSNISRSTFFSARSRSSHNNDEEDLDSIDGLSDEDSDDEDNDDDDNTPTKIVAKIKHGTILNGKGQLVSKAPVQDDQNSWLEDARTNRKVTFLLLTTFFVCLFV